MGGHAMFQPRNPEPLCPPKSPKSSRIDVAVFPVAGRGTRFLPATKASPKEMLPIVDKPLIQYAVEEALEAGARRLVFITGASKRAIEDHFDTDGELEGLLLKQGKSDLLKTLRSVLPVIRLVHLYPPARAPGTRARRVVRQARRGQRAVLRAPGGRSHRCPGGLPQADGAAFRRWQHRGRADRAEGPDRQVRHREDPANGAAICCAWSASWKSPSPRRRLQTSRWWAATCSRHACSRTWRR